MNDYLNKKWNVEDFVKILNEEVSLDSREGEDNRRTKEWNVRLLRHYTTEKVISKPLKEGRCSYYTKDHLQEIKNFINSQSLGISSKSYVKNTEKINSLGGNVLSSFNMTANMASTTVANTGLINNNYTKIETNEDLNKRKEKILSLLENIDQEKVSLRNVESFKNKEEYMWKHIKVNDYLTIQLREDEIDKKDEILKLLNNLR